MDQNPKVLVNPSSWLSLLIIQLQRGKLVVLILSGTKSIPGYHIVPQQIKFSALPVSILIANQKEDRFTVKGFDTWTHAVGDKNKGLEKHGKCDGHLAAVKTWKRYQVNPVSIEERLTSGRPAVVDQNRAYFTKVIKYIRWFCLQEIAFRGVEEHDYESNKRGNFRELMELEFELHSEFEEQRQAIMSQYSIHADYLSKTIYNEFVTVMATEVKNEIF